MCWNVLDCWCAGVMAFIMSVMPTDSGRLVASREPVLAVLVCCHLVRCFFSCPCQARARAARAMPRTLPGAE